MTIHSDDHLNHRGFGYAAVYALFDPRNPKRVHYIGTSHWPKSRRWQHRVSWKSPTTKAAKWVLRLHLKGIRVEMRILEWTQDYTEAEKRWIAYYEKIAPLLNIAFTARWLKSNGRKKRK